jgi:hypothetical protein
MAMGSVRVDLRKFRREVADWFVFINGVNGDIRTINPTNSSGNRN